MSSIILHPDVIRLRERIVELRRMLARELDEHIRLTTELLPKLRDRYGELFGELERGLQERTLEMSQRKRMVELFALKLDRGQKLDARMVEIVMKMVGNEFAEVRSRFARALDEESSRRERSRPRRDDVETTTPRQRADEVRKLYRRLAKRLHPDVRPTDDTLTRTYWDLVQKGYLRGDLGLLHTIGNVIESVGAENVPGSSMALGSEVTRLEAAVRQESARIASLKEGEPFVLREKLDDETWIAERRAGLEAELAGIEAEIEKCNRFLDPILESAKAASSPEIVRDIWSTWVESMYFNNR